MAATEPEHAYLKCITDAKKIHDSPFNLSPTKQLYSFTRSKRFNEKVSRSLCSRAFYDIPEKLYQGHKGTSLGYSQKYDFTKHSKNVPAPNAYVPGNLTIAEAVNKKHGYTFGVSRDMFKQSGMVFHLKNAASIPGPDAYFPALPKNQICASLKSRIALPESKQSKIGPGDYSIPPAFQTGKPLIDSRHRNVKGVRFPPIRKPEGGENQPPKTEVPEATLCSDTKFQMNGKGTYFNSKYHNTQSSAFPKQNRSMEVRKSDRPGPGYYQAPSEFGIYVSSKAG